MANVIPLLRQQEFSELKCGECGIVFAIETWLRAKWVEEKHDFYCPNGHSRRFIGETEAERIKRELTVQVENAKREAEWAHLRAKDAENRERAAKGQITKLKKRVNCVSGRSSSSRRT
jgi:hypothetical protein